MIRIYFDRQRLNDTLLRTETLNRNLVKLESGGQKMTERQNQIEVENTNLESEAEIIKGDLQAAQNILNEEKTSLAEAKKKLEEHSQAFNDVARVIGKLESELELIRGDRLAVLRKCKLEEIAVPLRGKGTLNDISLDKIVNYI